ncbi:Gfo/Idh/MocA family protein [Catellatospora bangladeshensis]|uniref:Oxidoreductase n=1 Tax=Catellatospora bangladeshensis TaxID=310355 RepID=A0A8J3JRK1_9ACTN|nr:Gfo/Idh/MocA family oxidoreductase [Catellatospora bangladeshensis]GIF85373.1 oxidoreductase [Catellatospora bangladeshensis]
MRTYDLAIVGTGGIAAVHAADVARLGGRARIGAVVDVDPDRLRAFTARLAELGLPEPQGYPDLDSLLAERRPDLVDLCTPPGLHAPQAIACLTRGLTVLCEKPPALSLAEFDRIAAAEAAGGGRFATVFQHRFGSGAANLRRLVGDPRLGDPLTAVCHTLWYRPDAYFAVPWRGRWDVEGGGPTMGHGIHQMDLLLSILGPWREVVAVAARRARPTDTEDLSGALVTFASGAVASVVNSLLSPRETSHLRFDLDHASVELTHLYGYGDGDWTVTAAPGHEQEVAEAWAEGPTGRPSGHGAQLSAVLDALDAGRTPPVGTAEARDTMELVAAIYASAFTRRPVGCGEIGPGSPFYERMEGPGAPWPAVRTGAAA